MSNYHLNVYQYGETLPIETLAERLTAATGQNVTAERVENSRAAAYRFTLSRELLRAERGHAIAISFGYVADIETERAGD